MNEEIYAKVYAAAIHAYAAISKGRSDSTMPKARESAEKTLNHFRQLIKSYPECSQPVPPKAIPANIDVNPEAGKF